MIAWPLDVLLCSDDSMCPFVVVLRRSCIVRCVERDRREGGRVTRVLEQIAETRRLQPDSASLLWLQGQCQADQGKTDEAIRSLEAALAVDE